MATETLTSGMKIQGASSSVMPYYCTESDWRDFTGFTDQQDFPSNEVITYLTNATEQVKKDGFHMVRYELVTKDSNDRYFTASRYWGNKYGRDNDIVHGTVQKYDLQIWEMDISSSTAASLIWDWSHVNNNAYAIPYDAITEIDPLNCWFKLDSAYPTSSNRNIFATYWVCGKPLDEISYELKMACMEATTIQALRKLKAKRLYNATTSYQLGKQSITRSESDFDELVRQHTEEYHKWVNWFRPFVGRRVRIGQAETLYNSRYLTQRYI